MIQASWRSSQRKYLVTNKNMLNDFNFDLESNDGLNFNTEYTMSKFEI